jgi:hypothetical protein
MKYVYRRFMMVGIANIVRNVIVFHLELQSRDFVDYLTSKRIVKHYVK